MAAEARRANRCLTKSSLEGAPIPHPRQLCFFDADRRRCQSCSLLRRKGPDVTRAIVLLLQTLATRRRLHFNELPSSYLDCFYPSCYCGPMAANDGPNVCPGYTQAE